MKLSTLPKLITVFGGSGFVGRHVVRELAAKGYAVRVAVRRPDLAGFLQPLGNVGQIQLVQANLRFPDSVEAAVKGADTVINLVGILAESGRQKFDAVQAEGAKVVAVAAKNNDAHLIHMSAIGADKDSASSYGETKAKGEVAVKRIVKDAIIMRPSIIFGPEDDFFNRFGAMSRIAPALPLIGGGQTKFQPIYVGDIAKAIVSAVEGGCEKGETYELGGPQIFSFRECLEILLKQTCRNKPLVNIPWFLAGMMAKAIGWLPGAPITSDQLEMLKSDNIVSDQAQKQKRTLEALGIQPTPMAAILPSYLVQYRPSGQFTKIADGEN